MPRDTKNHVSLVVIGHVDSGKSTTTGHLIYKCGGIDKRTIEKFEKEAAEKGKASFKYAWVMDVSRAERERGITIEQTSTKIETEHTVITIIDSPGHKDFIKNMITGTSACDYAILIIPGSKGEFETAIGKTEGTTHDHATLAYTMGIRVVLVAINKMDTVDYSQARYDEIVNHMKNFLTKIGFQQRCVAFIPISGFHGENITEPSTKMPWYTGWSYEAKLPGSTEFTKFTGVTLIEYLDRLPPVGRPTNKPFRLPCADVFKIPGVGTVSTGRCESGTVRVGEWVYVCPANITAEVKSIEMHHTALESAEPGDNIGMNLKNVAVSDLRRGHVIGHANKDPPREAESFVAQSVCVGNIGKNSGLHVGYTPVMDCHTSHIPAKIVDIVSKIDKRSGKVIADTEETGPRYIRCGEAGIIRCKPTAPMCLEVFSEIQALARFAFRDMKSTIAVGVIQKVDKVEPQGKGAAKGVPAKGGAPKAAAGGAKKAKK